MDPNACFARIFDLLAEGDNEEAFYACNDLINWLERGGFAPVPVKVEAIRELRRLLKGDQAS